MNIQSDNETIVSAPHRLGTCFGTLIHILHYHDAGWANPIISHCIPLLADLGYSTVWLRMKMDPIIDLPGIPVSGIPALSPANSAFDIWNHMEVRTWEVPVA